MPPIRILPEQVANQIAAGEVIERPAAVVKELVENSLDAGAAHVGVEFREGGRALIRVEDDGFGMGRKDALLSLERHATSKIAQTADLGHLTTFGFRGEALPSIASVSRFLLQTRAAESDAGSEISVNAGKILHVRDCGRPVGTSIEVAHLFHPVPARRKFLKSDQTETAHIVQCLRLYALANPGVSFRLAEDGREVFRSPACPDLRERVGEIFGAQAAEQLIPIDVSEGELRFHGLIGKPGVSRGNRQETIFFVNGRPVDSKALNYALAEGYHESVPKGRYPLAFVFLECPPAAVDVNVHPAKREVRFRQENAVRSFIIRAVLQTLRSAGPKEAEAGAAISPPGSLGPAEGAMWRGLEEPIGVFGLGSGVENRRPEVDGHPQKTGPAWRMVGMVHEAYGIFETPAGLVLLDRKAAAERIWFERLQGEFQRREGAGQRLLLTVPIELDPIAAALLRDRLSFLQAHGFAIAEFGGRSFRIEAVPTWMEPADAEPFLRDLLGAMREGKIAEHSPDLAREELARLAAARVARMGAGSGGGEIPALLAELFATRSPLTSPSGRPTFIEISHRELARRFEKG